MNRSNLVRLAVFTLLALMITALPATAQTSRAPSNDDIGSATTVTSREIMNAKLTVFSAQDAGKQTGEPTPSCASGSIFDTVWYRLLAPHEVEFVIDTFESTLNNSASNRNTVIALYTSSSPNPTGFATLSEVGCSENGTNQGFFTWGSPRSADTYYLQVGAAVALSSASTYAVDFGSRYQLFTNTSFGTDTAQLSPWTVAGTTGDKVKCGVAFPRVVDTCAFKFKTGPAENSALSYKLTGLSDLPHNISPTNYSEFVLNISHFTLRAQADATVTIKVKFSDDTKQKDSRTVDGVGAIFIDPLSGTTPTKATVKIKHTGQTGKPLYITQVKLYYAPGATGRQSSDLLPLPASPSQ